MVKLTPSDGGYAFPRPRMWMPYAADQEGVEISPGQEGMTVRQLYVGLMAQALLATGWFYHQGAAGNREVSNDLAVEAVKLADALIAQEKMTRA